MLILDAKKVGPVATAHIPLTQEEVKTSEGLIVEASSVATTSGKQPGRDARKRAFAARAKELGKSSIPDGSKDAMYDDRDAAHKPDVSGKTDDSL